MDIGAHSSNSCEILMKILISNASMMFYIGLQDRSFQIQGPCAIHCRPILNFETLEPRKSNLVLCGNAELLMQVKTQRSERVSGRLENSKPCKVNGDGDGKGSQRRKIGWHPFRIRV